MLKANIIILISIFVLGFSYSPKNIPPKVGELAPEINLPSVDRNKNLKLSDLKGKVVLVYFWASFAPPCRFETPNIVRAYNKYKDKGFTIYAVSLDTDINKWKSAINKDAMNWAYHVSDLKSYESAVVKNYGVKSVPYNFLLDKTGKVIAINLKGNNLSQTIDKYLK